MMHTSTPRAYTLVYTLPGIHIPHKIIMMMIILIRAGHDEPGYDVSAAREGRCPTVS